MKMKVFLFIIFSLNYLISKAQERHVYSMDKNAVQVSSHAETVQPDTSAKLMRPQISMYKNIMSVDQDTTPTLQSKDHSSDPLEMKAKPEIMKADTTRYQMRRNK
jgi:hypothetical protein